MPEARSLPVASTLAIRFGPVPACGVPAGTIGGVAFTRSDRSLILFTGAGVVFAALLFVAVILFSTAGSEPSGRASRALYLGDTNDLREKIALSPLYFASPFGDASFWLDVENGQIVALDVSLPGTESCNILWRGRANTYRDCNDDDIAQAEMARYGVTIVERGNRKGSVFVNLKERSPAPGLGPSGG